MQIHTKLTAGIMSAAIAGSMTLAGFAFADTTQTASTAEGGNWGSHKGQHMPGVFGTVASISGSTITLTGRDNTTYTIDATNATVTKSGSASSVSSIAVGDTLMVRGTVSGTSVTATAIHDGVGGSGMKGGRGMMPGVIGTIASASGNTLSVTGDGPDTGTTYTVDATNAKVEKDGSSSSIANIAVGDTVMVQGTVSGTNVTATTIHDGVRGPGKDGPMHSMVIQGNGQPVTGGSVTTITGTTITVTTKTNIVYTVDASSATVQKGDATSSVSNIAVGDAVIIQGTVNGTSVTASSIIDSGAEAAGTTQSADGPREGFGGFIDGIGGFFHRLFGFF